MQSHAWEVIQNRNYDADSDADLGLLTIFSTWGRYLCTVILDALGFAVCHLPCPPPTHTLLPRSLRRGSSFTEALEARQCAWGFGFAFCWAFGGSV